MSTPLPSHRLAAVFSLGLVALIAWLLAWELVIAPLKPGGSLLALKVVPLCVALPGVLRRRLYTLQWTSMLLLPYIGEAAVRVLSDPSAASRSMAGGEGLMAVAVFVAVVLYVRPFKRAARAARPQP